MKRPLRFEPLESRQLLAGNVTATVVNGELQVKGDGSSNYITIIEHFMGNDTTLGRYFQIIPSAYNGEYDAKGYPVFGKTPTTINGQNHDITLFASADKLRFEMGGANDVLYLGNNTYGGNLAGLTIDMGAGRDFLRFANYQFYGTAPTAYIRLGADTENNIDTIRMSGIYAPPAKVSIYTGGGNDVVDARDDVELTSLLVDAGPGNDSLSLVAMVISGPTTYRLGGGADTIYLYNTTYHALTIDGGATAERDVATLKYLQATDATFNMYGGDDTVSLVEDVYFSSSTAVNGGDGFDQFHQGPRVAALGLRLTSIEKFG